MLLVRRVIHEGRERKEISRDNRNEVHQQSVREEISQDNRNEVLVHSQSVREKKHNMFTRLYLGAHGRS
jgi:hypothetical protein